MAWIDKGYKYLSAVIADGKPYAARIRVHEEVDISENKSRLTFTVWAKAVGTSSYLRDYIFGQNGSAAYLKVDNVTVATFGALSSPTHHVNIAAKDTEYQIIGRSAEPSSWTVEIAHGADGKKTVSVTLSGRFYSGNSPVQYFDATWSASLVLEDIMRGSFSRIDDGQNSKYKILIDDGQWSPYKAMIDTGSWQQY